MITEIAAKQPAWRINPGDEGVFKYGQSYHYFGVLAPANMQPEKPDELIKRWMTLSAYCRTNNVVPVAVFYEFNAKLVGMAAQLNILTVGLSAGSFDKQVDGQGDFGSLRMVYWVRHADSADTRPDVLDEIEGKDGTLIPVNAATPAGKEVTPRVNPNTVLKDKAATPKQPAGGYENFPLPDTSVPLDEPSLPLELPEGLMDVVQQSIDQSEQMLNMIRERNQR